MTGDPRYDAYGSLAIGGLLVLVAVFLAIEIKGLLIGEGVEKHTKEAMFSYLQSREEIVSVLNIVTLQLGPDVMVAIKARMKMDTDANGLVDAINRCEVGFRRAFPDILWCFFEPDSED